MKKFFQIKFFVGILGLGLLVFASSAKAENLVTVYSYTGSAPDTLYASGGNDGYNFAYEVMATSTGRLKEITTPYFFGDSYCDGAYFDLDIYKDVEPTGFSTTTPIFSTSSITRQTTYDFSAANVLIESGSRYFVRLTQTGGSGCSLNTSWYTRTDSIFQLWWINGGSWVNSQSKFSVYSDLPFVMTIDTDVVPTPSYPTLNFIFPTASSSVPLFSDFLLSAQNLNDAEGYQVRLQYYLTDDYSTTTKLAGVRGQTDWTGFAYGIGSDFETKGVRIGRPNFGIDWADDNVMHVSAQLYASQDPNNPNASLAHPIMVASSSIAFVLEAIPTSDGRYVTPTMIPSSTAPYGFVVTTSTRPIGAVEAPTLGDFTDCSLIPFTDTYTGINIPFLASTAADRLMCELKSTANNWIADMGEFGNGTIETLLNLVNSVFPINVFSHINNDIDLARNATTTFTGDVVISGPNLFAGRSMKIISASGTAAALETLGGGEGSNFPIKSLFDKILYLITGGIILLVSAWEIKSLRDA